MVRDNDELRDLVQALEDLDLTYKRVRTLLKREIDRHQGVDDYPSTTPHTLFPGYPFKVGDQVQIKNPKLGQQKKGIVIGRTGEGDKGFIKVRTPNQRVLNRGPQNLVLE